MVTQKADYTGSHIIQDNMPTISYICSEQDNAKIQMREEDIDEIIATFTNTHHSIENDNIDWKAVEMELVRSTISTSPIYNNVIKLYGIMNDEEQELIGQKTINTISTTETTENVVFDLSNGACEPPLIKEVGTTSSGKIRLNLPIPLSEYESISLRRVWGDDLWAKRKQIDVIGTSEGDLINYPYPFTLSYDSDMKTDFSDLRFYDTDGRTLLNHYIIKKTDSSSVDVRVEIPIIPRNAKTRVFVEYGNSDALSTSNGFDTFTFFDDFEDGKYGRAYDSSTVDRSGLYSDWLLRGGTAAMETSSPISGTYSVKHTGDGTNAITNRMHRYVGGRTPLRVGFTLRCNTQGTSATTPHANLWITRYVDGNNYVGLFTYYDSGTNRQVLQFGKVVGGVWSSIATNNWLVGKMPTGTNYQFNIVDSGYYFGVVVDGVSRIGTNYTGGIATGTVGFGANYQTTLVWDNMYYYIPNIGATVEPTNGTLSSEESFSNNIIQPDSYSDYSLQYLLYTLPADYVNGSPICFDVLEMDSSIYETPDIFSNLTDIIGLGYDHVSKYQALRVVVETLTDKNNSIKWNIITYKYLV